MSSWNSGQEETRLIMGVLAMFVSCRLSALTAGQNQSVSRVNRGFAPYVSHCLRLNYSFSLSQYDPFPQPFWLAALA